MQTIKYCIILLMLALFLFSIFQFLLIAMGMKAATSNNSCVWCKIHNNER